MKSKTESEIKKKYQKRLEVSFIITLLFVSTLFFSFQRYDGSFELPPMPDEHIVFEVIPPTIQPKEKPKPPEIPRIVPGDEEEEMIDDIDLTTIFDPNMTKLQIPEVEDIYIPIWEASEPPSLKYQAIPEYPDLARRAGIEGTVSVIVYISKTGEVLNAEILKGIEMLNNAALEAAKKCLFNPAKQRDKFVKVKMSIPFKFTLR